MSSDPQSDFDDESALSQAFVHHKAGRLDQAEKAYRTILERYPHHGEALHHLGLISHQRGDSETGVEMIRKAIGSAPAPARYYQNLAAILKALGREHEAELAYREAASEHPGTPDEIVREARTLQHEGRLVEALHMCRMALSSHPLHLGARIAEGEVLIALGRLPQAFDIIDEVLRQNPDNADALALRGWALMESNLPEEARTVLEKAYGLDPDCFEAHNGLAMLHERNGQFTTAIPHLMEAIRIGKGRPRLRFRLGNALSAVGRPAEAEKCYREFLEHNPDDPYALTNLAHVLIEQNRFHLAHEACNKVIRLNPELAEAHANLAMIHQKTGRMGPALEAFRKALQLKPALVQVLNNMGGLLLKLGRFEEAMESYREAVALAPDFDSAQSNILFASNYRECSDRQESFEQHLRFARVLEARCPSPPIFSNDPSPGRRLRIGFVSPDLNAHPISIFIEPLFEHYDRESLSIICYAAGLKSDHVTERLRGRVDEWRDICGVPDFEASQLIQRDKIDILVDLAGHLGHNRLPLFAHKPAPIQATYLSYLNTSGLSRIDYYLSDPYLTPQGSDRYFSEAIYRLPRFFACFATPQESVPVVEPPIINSGSVTFGCFNNATKISPGVIKTWSRILAEIPEAALLLRGPQLGVPSTQDQFRALFAEENIPPSRIQFRPQSVERESYLADFSLIDVALDPFPYNGVTTTCEALWMGVPVVTLQGDFGFSRAGVSILSNLGMPELIASDSDRYVEIALSLARDPQRLARLRESLRGRMIASPLCDGAGFAHDMESAFRDMWREWCASQNDPPAPEIPASPENG